MPPTGIEMIGQTSGSTMTVRSGESVSLECLAKNGKPASKIQWFRGSERIRDGEFLIFK